MENVDFQDTTTYHWGKFDSNSSDTDFEDAQGPFAFGLATKLNKEKKQVSVQIIMQRLPQKIIIFFSV